MSDAGSMHHDSIVIDGLNVSRWGRDTFAAMKQAGVTASNATVTVRHGFRQTVEMLADWQRWFETESNVIAPVLKTADIHDAKKSGRAGIILGFQNATPIEDDLRLISVFKSLGVRIVQLTYNTRNHIGDGCMETPGAGLSHYGRAAVREMNRQGVLIDLSHCGYQTTMDAIERSEAPVALTHANPRALCPSPRNHLDEEFEACASKGGVIGATAFPSFLPTQRQSVEGLIDAIDYLVALVGIDHVGIGLDFIDDQPREYFFPESPSSQQFYEEGTVPEWPWTYPDGVRSTKDWPNVTTALLRRGYLPEDARKIIGLNFLRLFDAVWR